MPGRRPEDFKPIAFVLVKGPKRPGEGWEFNLGGEGVVVEGSKQTKYALGFDGDTGRMVAEPFSGDVEQYGDVPVIDTALQPGELQRLAETFDPMVGARSPRKASSRKIPSWDYVGPYDAARGSQTLTWLANIDQLAGGGLSIEVQLEAVMDLAKKLEVLGYRFPGVYSSDEENGEVPVDDGVEF